MNRFVAVRSGAYCGVLAPVLALALLTGLALPARASEVAAPRASQDFAPAPQRVAVDKTTDAGAHFWVWAKGNRGYTLEGGKTIGFTSIRAFDLASGAVVEQAPLEVAAYRAAHARHPSGNAVGLDNAMAIDEEGGRLIVATQWPTVTPTGATNVAQPFRSGSTCLLANTAISCLSGFSVLDAETLQHVRHVPLRTVQADGGPLAAQLLAMSFAPAFEGQPAKVHLLMEEMVHSPPSLSVAQPRNQPSNFVSAVYLAQLDPESGSQDWVVRVDTCQGVRPTRTVAEQFGTIGVGHLAAVFRSRTPGDRAVYAACHARSQSMTAAVVRVALDADGMARFIPLGELSELQEFPALDAEPGVPESASRFERPASVEGPDNVYQMIGDAEGGRIAIQVLDGVPKAQVWWIFDTRVMQFIGTIGIGGPADFGNALATVSPDHGRLYVLAQSRTDNAASFQGGLFATDIRQTPVAQALLYPELEEFFPTGYAHTQRRASLTPQPLADGATRLWLPAALGSANSTYHAFDDLRGPKPATPLESYAGRTADLDEAEGVTSASMDGAARGYGFRAVLVGGAEAAARVGPIDPVGTAGQCNDHDWGDGEWGTAATELNRPGSLFAAGSGRSISGGMCYYAGRPLPYNCLQGTREVILAYVGPDGPAVLDGGGARGAAKPVAIDTATTTDSDAPASRCSGQDWDQTWAAALFGHAPAREPSIATWEPLGVECFTASERASQHAGDPVADGYSAQVTCDHDQASGHAYARGASLDAVSVAESISSFRIYQDPERGIVSRVESVARGIRLGDAITIDTVRGEAESWANGRMWAGQERDGQTYDPNCDYGRTAGTCFWRHLFGLRTPTYACGACGDEQAFVRGLNAALNPGVLVRLREPDAKLREGAVNGFTAAIQKPEHERFADMALNQDLLQTVLPTLEIVRFAPPGRYVTRGGPRGRQIYQFAGVEVSSSYGISCLLMYNADANTCGLPEEPPGAIKVSLADEEGRPLAGGAFELRADVDGDGLLGLRDTLLPNSPCITADDGVGTCMHEGLVPGGYLIQQMAAPPGFARSVEPFLVEMTSGQQHTVDFTNVPNVSTMDLLARTEAGEPVAGAEFAVFADPDADGKVAHQAPPVGSCTTDGEGRCKLRLPAGLYVLAQTAAPQGLQAIDSVPFAFASGGQVAAVTLVYYPADAPPAQHAATSPSYEPPSLAVLPVASIDAYEPPIASVQNETPSVDLAERAGRTLTRVIRVPGDAMRLLARDPAEVAAFMSTLALLAVTALAIRRRRVLQGLMN